MAKISTVLKGFQDFFEMRLLYLRSSGFFLISKEFLAINFLRMQGWTTPKIKVFMISLTLILAALFSARAHAENKFQVIAQIQDWKKETTARKDLDEHEKDLRLDFIDRLIFQVERKYQENSLKDFLVVTLEDMSDTDQMTSNQSFGNLGPFLVNLRIALTQLMEKNERPLPFIENFTEYSGISEPASVDEFANTRSYYDGKHIRAAKPMSLDEAATVAEQKETEATQKLQWSLLKSDLKEQFTPPELSSKIEIPVELPPGLEF